MAVGTSIHSTIFDMYMVTESKLTILRGIGRAMLIGITDMSDSLKRDL